MYRDLRRQLEESPEKQEPSKPALTTHCFPKRLKGTPDTSLDAKHEHKHSPLLDDKEPKATPKSVGNNSQSSKESKRSEFDTVLPDIKKEPSNEPNVTDAGNLANSQ